MALCLLLVIAALTPVACSSTQKATPLNPTRGTRVGPGLVDADEVQSELMTFADNANALIADALIEIQSETEDPTVRLNASQMRLSSASSMIATASGPNPLIGAVDMAVQITLERDAVERWGAQMLQSDATELNRVYTILEKQAWDTAMKVITPEQQAEAMNIIDRWWTDFPNQKIVSHIRLAELADYRRKPLDSQGSSGGSIFSLLHIDPLAGLDPTVRQVEQARLLGERVMYFAERVHYLVRLQAEVMVFELMTMPEIDRTFDAVEAFGDSAERITVVAESLPDDVNAILDEQIGHLSNELSAEREAAVDQFFEKLDASSTELDSTIAELHATIDSATVLAEAVQSTVVSVESLTARSTSDEPPSGEPRKPIEMAEIQAIAEQTTVAVEQLNTLVGSIEQLLDSPSWDPRMDNLDGAIARVDEAGADLIDHAFRRGLMLIGVLLLGVVGVLAIHRAIPRRS